MSRRPGQEKLTVVSISYADACAAVNRLHRHHRKPQGHKWSHGVLTDGGRLCGVAIVGRPTSRCFDEGWTVEVTRVATDGTPNACSALYGAAWRKASVDFWRAITYTQEGESGASLKAAGWRKVAELTPRKGWDTPSRRRADQGTDNVARVLWEKTREGAPPLPSIRALRDELRDEIQCVVCAEAIPITLTRGRPRTYCSRSCQQRAYRLRLAA